MNRALKSYTYNLTLELIDALQTAFYDPHLSGNSARTIRGYILKNQGNEIHYQISIPAECYDIPRYKKEGVIIHTGGSYANELEEESGGFSGKHKHQTRNTVNAWIWRYIVNIDKSNFELESFDVWW